MAQEDRTCVGEEDSEGEEEGALRKPGQREEVGIPVHHGAPQGAAEAVGGAHGAEQVAGSAPLSKGEP